MRRFFKTVGIVFAVVLVVIAVALAYLYTTLCTGHPHGMC